MCADVSSPTRFLTGIAERFQRRQAQVVGDRHLVESCDDFRNLINRGVPVVVRDCLPERDGVAAEHDGLIKREGAHRGIGGEVLRDLRLGRELVGAEAGELQPGEPVVPGGPLATSESQRSVRHRSAMRCRSMNRCGTPNPVRC